jgi:hypothetical protein
MAWYNSWNDFGTAAGNVVDTAGGLFGVGDTTKGITGWNQYGTPQMGVTDTRGWGDVAKDVGGLHLDYRQGQQAEDAAANTLASQRQASAEALARAQPWDISAPTGVASFNPETQQGMMGLTPEMEAYRKIFMTRAPSHAAAIAPYEQDPFGSAQALYAKEQELYAPEQERQRLAAEKRLVSQGMFGSSGGGAQMQALLDAQGQQDLARQNSAYARSQAMIDLYRGREIGDIEAASQIAAQPIKLAELGRGIGSGLTGVINTGLSNTSTALTNLGDTQAAKGSFWKSIL